MTSSSRTAHLRLWRAIVSKGNEGTEPIDQHLDFIRRRFDELESKGFVWSKESILDIFLSLRLSESPHGALSSDNEMLDSRVLQGFGIPSNEAQTAIRNKELRHESRPAGFMDLPIEVVNNIIEQLDCMAELESDEIEKQKDKGRVMVYGLGEQKPYWTYLHRHSPILNSIQTFSLASRQIYQLCRPWLWRKLQFPTSLPAPIDLWTEDILLKQGSYVQSVLLGLSENCSQAPDGAAEYDPFYDNLIPFSKHGHSVKGISPKNARDLIDRCPNLSTLSLTFDYNEQEEEIGGIAAFVIDLLPRLSSLQQLRHLELLDEDGETINNGFMSNLVDNLPLLKSFVYKGFRRFRDQQRFGDVPLGSNLSKLKHLSRLNLSDIDDINEDWCLYDWSGTITDLTIHTRWSFLPSSAHRIIHHIAPRLKKLEICFPYKETDDVGETDRAWNPERRFSLPFLTELILSSWNTDFLDSFQNCHSISHLDWTYRSLEHCQSLNENLLKASWTQLTTLIVRPYPLFTILGPSALDHKYEEIEEQLVLLEKYCEQVNIEAYIFRRKKITA